MAWPLRLVIGALAVLGLVGALLIVARVAAFKPYTFPSASMEPTIRNGDYIVVMQRPFARQPMRGDMIAFWIAQEGHTVTFVKRVLGLPGDRVQLKGGQVLIDGEAVRETPLGNGTGDLPQGAGPVRLFAEHPPGGARYEIQLSPNGGAASETGVYTVPPHCYFVLGDNRDNSLDSRFDPGVPPNETGGCPWDESLDDQVGDEPGAGYVPDSRVTGVVLWDLTHPINPPPAAHAGG